MGSNMAENHPVGFQWVLEAQRRGATIIHVDPRFTRTSALADIHVPIRAGTDIAFLGGLVNFVLENGREFGEYVRAYSNAASCICEEFVGTDELDGLFSGWDPDTLSYDPSSWAYQCEDGNGTLTDACPNCQNARCGDGYRYTGFEQCDDGNSFNTDTCVTGCMNARCGDGFTQNNVEQCDDANPTQTDACLSNCQNARCGDGQIRAGVEQCDDSNTANDDACVGTTCQNARCGDGFKRTTEACDDGNTDQTDTCLNSCVAAGCGDGQVWTNVEQCDMAGTNANTGACTLSCQNARCGDGFIYAGVEACDDGITNGTILGGCNANCTGAL